MARVVVDVMLKPEILDPQGQAVAQALPRLGFDGIADVLNQQGHVNFNIVRPAGTFQCEGWMKDGKGSGHFTFAPNAQFSAELAKRGLGTPNERQSLRLAMGNASLSLVDALKAKLPDPDRNASG